jgi:lysophospholipase L1-like esterase
MSSPTPSPPRRRRLAPLLALSTGVVFVMLICFEVFLQVVDPGGFADLEDHERFSEELFRKGEDGALHLVPGVTTSYLGREVKVSEQGLRNRIVEVPKPAGTFRILVIGDSVPFGWGVGEGEAFPAVLERLLREHSSADNRRYEVVNGGSPGWGFYEEFLWLHDRGISFEPDVVVQCIINNDVEPGLKAPPLFLTPSLRQVRTLRLLERIADVLTSDRGFDGVYFTPDLVSRAIDEIQKVCSAAGARYVLFDLFGLAPPTIEHAEQVGVPRVACVLDDEWVHAHQVGRHDYHPNAEGHAWLAQRLFEGLQPLLKP